mmetsp:Transcript_18655/g.38538  ORF Transcript_18655/g.38538 Transcript_18655/m.38538 type:complete len:255 (-) Transcript_18655:551-1315(-)
MLYSISLGLAVLPLPTVTSSVCPNTLALAVIFSALPISTVDRSIGKNITSCSMSKSLVETACVYRPIRPRVCSLTLTVVHFKATVVHPSVAPFISAMTVSLVVAVLSNIGIFVGKNGMSVTMPSTLPPITRVKTTILVVHRSLSVWLPANHHTCVSSFVAIWISDCLILYLLQQYQLMVFQRRWGALALTPSFGYDGPLLAASGILMILLIECELFFIPPTTLVTRLPLCTFLLLFRGRLQQLSWNCRLNDRGL